MRSNQEIVERWYVYPYAPALSPRIPGSNQEIVESAHGYALPITRFAEIFLEAIKR